MDGREGGWEREHKVRQINGKNGITDERGTGRSGARDCACGGGSGGAVPSKEASASPGAS